MTSLRKGNVSCCFRTDSGKIAQTSVRMMNMVNRDLKREKLQDPEIQILPPGTRGSCFCFHPVCLIS
ncbi:MAG: hypothetical protein DRH37_00065 [Deltaproteobacteria bacterium]|nr:MAG: hypothetical protein DRH37_00065 [Deltaproteobacteria bacterium]